MVPALCWGLMPTPSAEGKKMQNRFRKVYDKQELLLIVRCCMQRNRKT